MRATGLYYVCVKKKYDRRAKFLFLKGIFTLSNLEKRTCRQNHPKREGINIYCIGSIYIYIYFFFLFFFLFFFFFFLTFATTPKKGNHPKTLPS